MVISNAIFACNRLILASLVLMAIILPLSSQADSSSTFCELSNQTGGSCIVLDKNNPDFSSLFEHAVINILLSTLQPTITAITPPQLPQGSTANILITAPFAHFNNSSLTGIEIKGGILVNFGEAVFPPHQLIANVIVPANTPLGFYDVTVTTTLADDQEEIVMGKDMLQIIQPPTTPQILSVTPSQVSRSSTPVTLLIYGQNTHFDSSSTVNFGDSAITVLNQMIHAPTVLEVIVNVAETARVGFHPITITSSNEIASDQQSLGILQVFESVTLTPRITAIQPWHGHQLETLTVKITGQDTHFEKDVSQVTFQGEGIEVLQTMVESHTQMQALLKIHRDAPLGLRDVFITTGAEIAIFTKGFALFSHTIIQLDKVQGARGTLVTLTITGEETHFVPGKSVLNIDQKGITVSDLTVSDATHATAVLQIAADAVIGPYQVAMVTEGEVAVPPTNEVFTVVDLKVPFIESVTPKQAVRGETIKVVVIGNNTHFQSGTPQIKFEKGGIIVKESTVSSDVNMKLLLEITTDAPLGSQGMTITNDLEIAQLANAFTVKELPKFNLTIKSNDHGKVVSKEGDIDCGNGCTASLTKNTPVELVAIPTDSHFQFLEWGGDCHGDSAEVSIILVADTTCEAKFVAIESTLTLNTTGQGKGTINPHLLGSECGISCQKYLQGTTVTLEALSNIGSHFSEWQGDCSGLETTVTVTLDTDKTCTAIFENLEAPSATPQQPIVPSETSENTQPTTSLPNELGEDDEKTQPVLVMADEYGTQSTTVLEIPPEDEISITSQCTPDPKLTLQPLQQTVLLPLEEGQKILSFAGGQGAVKLLTAPDTATVVAVQLSQDSYTGQTQLILKPQQAGKTQLILNDCANHQALIDITVTAQQNVLRCDNALKLQPELREIILGVADKPLALTFKGGQGQVTFMELPNDEIVMLKLPIYSDNGLTQVEIAPRQVGETQLTLRDECNHQAQVKVKVITPPLCPPNPQLAFQPSQTEVTLMMGETPLWLNFSGGQVTDQDPIQLLEVPDARVVNLQLPFYSEPGLTQLALSPRQAGDTFLTLGDCAHHQAQVHITVLKPNTLAALCWLDQKTTGICQQPDNQMVLHQNVMGMDSQGNPVEPVAAHLKMALQPVAQPTDQLTLLSTDKLKVDVKLFSADLQDQPAELLGVIEHQGSNDNHHELFFLKTVRLPNNPTLPEQSVVFEENQGNAESGEPALERWCELMNNTRTKPEQAPVQWQRWDGKIVNLSAATYFENLAAITELPLELDLQGLPVGEFKLYLGYRLTDGTIIFNGHQQPHFWIANSQSIPKSRNTRAYFSGKVQSQEVEQPISITATIRPEYHHLGKTANLLMVAFYLQPSGEITRYMRLPDRRWLEWNNQTDTLVPTQQNVTLTDSLEVDVFHGNLNGWLGTVQLWVGYEIDGSIVFNGQEPIELVLPFGRKNRVP